MQKILINEYKDESLVLSNGKFVTGVTNNSEVLSGTTTTTTTTAAPTTTTTAGPTTTAAPLVTNFGLQILTPMNKIERVSRSIDTTVFTAIPGIWAALQTDTSIKNVTVNTPELINKLVIGSRSGNIYEGHDTMVGRIATMESVGVRCKVSTNLYSGVISLGDFLVVSTAALTAGQLVSKATTTEHGTYEVVARCEGISTSLGYMIYRTVSPYTVSL